MRIDEDSSEEESHIVDYHPGTKIFSRREINTAINAYHCEKLGNGGFGTVYRGYWNEKGIELAIKKLTHGRSQGPSQFENEVSALTRYKHPHIIELVGYSSFMNPDREHMIYLVYEYMALGSLDKYLYGVAPDICLSWNQRLQIALDVASALKFLHDEASTPTLYNDMNSANILLDHRFRAKLSDFGLSRFGPIVSDESYMSQNLMGTPGYVPVDYMSDNRSSRPTDVFGFGVVLLELFSGHRAQMNGFAEGWRQLIPNRRNHPKIVNPLLKDECSPEALADVLAVVGMCVHEDSKKRPSMSDVFLVLEHLVSKTYTD